jgi:hypothetical protein
MRRTSGHVEPLAKDHKLEGVDSFQLQVLIKQLIDKWALCPLESIRISSE